MEVLCIIRHHRPCVNEACHWTLIDRDPAAFWESGRGSLAFGVVARGFDPLQRPERLLMTLFCPPHWQTREFTKTPALSPGAYSYSIAIKFLDTDRSPVVLWRHVRRRGHHRAQTQPLQPPARRRPSAHLLRQAARHHAPRQPPPVRRRRDRPDPPARHPRPAPRRGTRSQGDPRRSPAGRLARAAAHVLPPPHRRPPGPPPPGPPRPHKPTSLACPRKRKSPPRYAAVRSVPSSPTSAAISASRRTIRCGPT